MHKSTIRVQRILCFDVLLIRAGYSVTLGKVWHRGVGVRMVCDCW